MTFQEAEKRLKVLADGDFYTISYEIRNHQQQEVGEPEKKQPVCEVYINDFQHSKGLTWENALAKMEIQKRMFVPDKTESPIEDETELATISTKEVI